MKEEQLEPDYKGKVRNLYYIDDRTMIIEATDRISAFDKIFPNLVKGKGELLTKISNFWFEKLRASKLPADLGFKDHKYRMISGKNIPKEYEELLINQRDTIFVKRVKRVDYECIVRGYICGSLWKEYGNTPFHNDTNLATINGIDFPEDMKFQQKFDEPIFTPSTKAPDGEHDVNVSFDKMQSDLGIDLADKLRSISLEIFEFASKIMLDAGLILVDTKFEFGLDENGNIVLIDEVLTPDSSRYWLKEDYLHHVEGTTIPQYDKQILRDWVNTTDWDKESAPPEIPEEIIEKIISRYQDILNRLEKIVE